MRVTEVKDNILILEYRQDSSDEDYGSCLWARFYFNLDKYELLISSDCGSYGYKWPVAKRETFLELMARCNDDYILGKIYGSPDVFDYDETKKRLYDMYKDEPYSIENLNQIYADIEQCYEGTDSADEFIRVFDEFNSYFYDTWEFPVKVYPNNVLKIVQVFENYIKPKIKEIIK